MSDYSNKLAILATKKNKLFEEEIKLIHKRKNEIANLAERCELLTCSDELLAGLFLEFKKYVESKDRRIQEWEIAGGRFLKSNKTKSTNCEAAQTTTGEKSTPL